MEKIKEVEEFDLEHSHENNYGKIRELMFWISLEPYAANFGLQELYDEAIIYYNSNTTPLSRIKFREKYLFFYG